MSIILSIGCLLAGSILYILFRPTTLLMFHWVELIGLEESIGIMRIWANGFDVYLSTWSVFSLPFALWVLSYMFFTNGIWKNSTSLVRYVWFWSLPIIAIFGELSQSIHIIPGHFDIGDLIALIFVILLGFFIIHPSPLRRTTTL